MAEVADLLHVTEGFVRRLIATGELPAVRLGTRLVRVRAAEVEALLDPGVALPASHLPTAEAVPLGRRRRGRARPDQSI
ncbi:helix-turn-helix transcriptional regulator [Cellulomonas soli]|uniref:helix-turn-helix transcriptional regulator n=1 Tax=Cellulomonas soli TaxID=931535 RepID=UPI001CB77B66|nr:helix-turn-helix domain-containing protein [Cellulomonas soli]